MSKLLNSYETPEVEILNFECPDIITSSGPVIDNSGEQDDNWD